MQDYAESLNQFLVEVFHEILKVEEKQIESEFTDLSLRELHLIEAVFHANTQGRDNRATAIATAQRVTAGTLTTVATQLEKKGYIERRRDDRDRRVVRILLTAKGEAANARHAAYHQQMVDAVLTTLTPEELAVFTKGLRAVARFFQPELTEKEN